MSAPNHTTGQGMSPGEVLAFLQSVPATSGMSEPVELLENVDEAVDWLEKEVASPGHQGDTPLHLVADYEWLPYTAAQVARRLLELGANPNARDEWGRTPLQSLCEDIWMQGRGNDICDEELQLATALLDGGANPLLPMPERPTTPAEIFPDLVAPWLTAAAMDATLPTPLATRARERF